MKVKLSEAMFKITGDPHSINATHFMWGMADYCSTLDFYDNQPEIDEHAMIHFKPRPTSNFPVNVRVMSFTKFFEWVRRNLTSADYTDRFNNMDVQPIQDQLVNWCAATLDTSRFTYELVTGKDIVAAYKTGPDSCMKGKVGQHALYVENPDKVSLLKIYENGVYTGRVLRWLLDETKPDGSPQYLLDRVYPGNGVLSAATKTFAKDQGWHVKNHDSVGFDSTGFENAKLEVTLKHPKNRRIAYLDSVRYLLKADDRTLTLTAKYDNEKYVSLPGMGDFEGYSNLYSSNLKYLDGMPYVHPLIERKGYSYSMDRTSLRIDDSVTVETLDVKIGRHVQRRVLRPDDVVYDVSTIPEFILTQDQVVKIGDYYYLKPEVRKIRNSELYAPKATAQAYRIKNTQKVGQGTMISLEVVV